MDFGLAEKEAKIYLALLELEVATVHQIAKQSGVNRSSTYVVLDILRRKGFAGISEDKEVRHYVAADPETLLHKAETAVKKQEGARAGIESIIPELKALHKDTRHRPVVKIFEGQAGIKELLYDVFRNNTTSDLKTYSDASKLFKFFPELMEYSKERAALGIKMYAINPATKEVSASFRQNPPPKGDNALFIPVEKFNFPVNMGIYGSKVAFISMEGEFGILIESKEIVEAMRSSFDLSWEEAKRLDREIKKKKTM